MGLWNKWQKGDIVVYVGGRKYPLTGPTNVAKWMFPAPKLPKFGLKLHNKYRIKDYAIDDQGTIWYSVFELNNDNSTCWFGEYEFITEQEYRKLKLKSLDENC